MKKIFSLVLAFLLINVNSTVFAAIHVPNSTQIVISPVEKVTSQNPQTTIRAEIKDDVVVNDVVIFRSGDMAEFNISDYEKASYMGVAGNLTVYNGYAYDTKGNKHKVLINKNFVGKTQIWAQILTSLSLTIILLPLALFAFVHGTNAVITPGTELHTVLYKDFEY